MSGSLRLGESGLCKAVLHGIEQSRIAGVVEVCPEHDTDTLGMQRIDQLAQLRHRAIVLVGLGVIQRIIPVVAIVREIVDGSAA